jgi:hypothetical protein
MIRLRLLLPLALFFAIAVPAHAQGCAACRDNVAGSSPRVRSAFRKAIPVLGVPAFSIFIGALWIGMRRRDESETTES